MNERRVLNIFSDAVSFLEVGSSSKSTSGRKKRRRMETKDFRAAVGKGGERVSPGEESGVEEGEENFCRPQQEKKRSESQSLKFSTVVWRDFSPPLFLLVRVS